MNVEIGAEAAQFPEKEYKNMSFLAVYDACLGLVLHLSQARYYVLCPLSVFGHLKENKDLSVYF